MEDPQVHDHGAVAIVVGVQDQQTSFQQRDSSGRFRLTAVVLRREDRWLLAGVHIGPLQEAPIPPSG